MGIFLIIACSVVGLVVLCIAGVCLFDFVAGIIDRKYPRRMTPDEQRAADYAAYKAKMR